MNMKKLRYQYRYSSLPEKIPMGLKHGVKKLLSPNSPSMGVSYRTTLWARRMSRQHTEYVKRRGRRRIESATIRSSHSYAMLSYRTERLLESISRKKYYRFEDMMIVLDPHNQAPLTAVAIFYTKEPMGLRYRVKGKTKDADYTMTLKPCCYHRVPILGLYPATKNPVHMELLDTKGKVVAERTVTVTTKELPEKMKDMISVKKRSGTSAYNMILISGGLHINTCAFDQNGDIRWYLRRRTKAYGIFPLSGGRFLYMEKWVDVPSYSVSQACMAYEMDYLGRIYKTYFYENGFHHCAREKEPGGNILLGSNSLHGHDENMVIELDRNTGKIVDSLNMDDLFDDTYKSWTDWCHVNAVSYNAKDHSVIVSMRNIHTVVKVNWDTKELVWVLSNPEMWKGTSVEDKVLSPVGDVKWIYQQHAAYQLEENLDGNPDTIQMIVYDNHWDRRRPVEFYDGDEEHSYLSIFTIDEQKMTVSMEHTTKCPNSRIRSNAILELEQGRIFNMAGDLVPDLEGNKGIIEEYDYETGEPYNQWYVKPGFFTAYPFLPEGNALEATIPEETQYWQGSTIPVQPFSEKLDFSNVQKLDYQQVALDSDERIQSDEEESEGENLSEEENPSEETSAVAEEEKEKEIEIHFQEDVLFVKAVDHSISYIYFIGKKHSYYVDLTGTYQTMDIFRDKIYEIPLWLKDMEKDTYHIYYRYKEGLFDSEADFTISEEMY